MLRGTLSLTLLAVAVATSALFAQHNSTAPGFCYPGRPSSACRVFPLTEFSLYSGETIQSGLGGMVNVSRRIAVGATANLDDDGGWIIRPRLRVWTINPISVDVTVFKRKDFVPEVSVGVGDWIAVTAQRRWRYFWTLERGDTHDADWITGVRFGFVPGIVTGLLTAALGIIIFGSVT